MELGGSASPDQVLNMLVAPLRPGGRAVILAAQEMQLARYPSSRDVLLRCTARVSGRLVDFVVIDAGERFASTPVGNALALAWECYRVGE